MLQGKLRPRERSTTIVRPSRSEWLRSAEDVCFLTLLETLTATSMVRPISRIYLLAADERHQLLVDCNITVIPVPAASQPVLFQAQVAHIPDTPAVVSADITLTYTQLNATANHLARHPIDQGWAQKRNDIDRNPHFEETILSSGAKLGSVVILGGE
ncbi:MAG: hypothetical protein JO287_22710 [Pseudonocardiales bacterium]|nr:hypothetical protein [Pseudonocardiales bacterium]